MDERALDEGRKFLAALPAITQAGGFIDHIPLHWAVETYTMGDKAYNGVVRLGSDKAWHLVLETDPNLNSTIPEQPGYAEHTWKRNGHGFGLAVEAMLGATPSNFGLFPIQQHQIEMLCAGAAAVAAKYGIQCMDDRCVYTHAEAAILDGYFGERWDLARLAPDDFALTRREAIITGDQLRGRCHDYKLTLIGANF